MALLLLTSFYAFFVHWILPILGIGVAIAALSFITTRAKAQANAGNTALWQTTAATSDTEVIIKKTGLYDSIFNKTGNTYTLSGLLPTRQWYPVWLIQGLSDSLSPYMKISSFTSAAIITALTFTPISQAQARTSISLTTTGTSGNATYDNSTGIFNIPNYTTPTAPSFNLTPNRSLSTTGTNNTFTISTTKNARVHYTINFSYSLTLTTSNGLVSLDYSTDGGSTWITVSSVSNAYTLAVTLSGNTDAVLSGEIPANALCRIYRSANTNVTVTASTSKQEEITY